MDEGEVEAWKHIKKVIVVFDNPNAAGLLLDVVRSEDGDKYVSVKDKLRQALLDTA